MSNNRFGSITRREFLSTSTATLGALATASLWRPSTLMAAAPRSGGILRVSVAERATSLNPFTQINNVGYLLSEMSYMGVTRIGPDMKPQPDAAESWTANDDASEFTFKLREGLTFHDGKKVTAEDAVHSLKAVLDPETASPARKSVGPIKDATVVDGRTFKVMLDGSFADLPVSITSQNFRIAPASVVEQGHKFMDSNDVGSGPFRVVDYDPGRKVTLRRFDKYYDAPRPYLDGVEIVLYPDLAGEAAALLNGETDIMLRVGAADFDRLSTAPKITGRRQETGRFLNFVLRMDTKPFDDLRVRQALALSLDRDALVTLVQEGYGRPAYDNIISPEYRYAIKTPVVERDVVKAKELLAAAGYPNGVKVTCFVANRPAERTSLAVSAKEMAKPAGFDIDVKVIPYDEYIANVWRKAGFYVASWNMAPIEDRLLTQLMTSDAPWHDAAWNNEKFDAVVYEARRTLDEKRRAELYGQAQSMMIEDLPYLVPFYQDFLSAQAKYVMDYTMHPMQYPHFLERAWMTEEAPKRA